MEPILAIEEWQIPRCSECKGYDGLGRADEDPESGEWWWWCRACDPALAPPEQLAGQMAMDLGDADALVGVLV